MNFVNGEIMSLFWESWEEVLLLRKDWKMFQLKSIMYYNVL